MSSSWGVVFWSSLVLFSLAGPSVFLSRIAPVTTQSPEAPGSFSPVSVPRAVHLGGCLSDWTSSSPLSCDQCSFFPLFRLGMDLIFLEVSGSTLSPASGSCPPCPAASSVSSAPEPRAGGDRRSSCLLTGMLKFGYPLRSQSPLPLDPCALSRKLEGWGLWRPPLSSAAQKSVVHLGLHCSLYLVSSVLRSTFFLDRNACYLEGALPLDLCGLLGHPGTLSTWDHFRFKSLCPRVSLSHAVV